MTNTEIGTIIEKALDFLYKKQESCGAFYGVSVNKDSETKSSKSPFATGLILNALASIKGCPNINQSKLHTITSKAVAYLLQQKDEIYPLWNYWEKGQLSRRSLPFDLDDTSVIVSAIKTWCPDLITDNDISKIIKILTLLEKEFGGPYNTWFIDNKKDSKWQDFDIAVNANIAYMLSCFQIRNTELSKYFQECISTNNIFSQYYISTISILYFISRVENGDRQYELKNSILRKLKLFKATNVLDTAMAISATCLLKANADSCKKMINLIISSQNKDTGGWPSCILYFEYGNRLGKKTDRWHHGSDALTTSYCIEALQLFKFAGSLSGIEPESRVPQTPVLTVTP